MKKRIAVAVVGLVLLATLALAKHGQFTAAVPHGVVQAPNNLTICPKNIIDSGTVVSVPTGCVDSTGKSTPRCVDSKGAAIVAGQQVLPDSITLDSKGHTVTHFTVCAGEQVQWHTNVGMCP